MYIVVHTFHAPPQDWFSAGGGQFVGVIVSPYDPRSGCLASAVNCLTASHAVNQLTKASGWMLSNSQMFQLII